MKKIISKNLYNLRVFNNLTAQSASKVLGITKHTLEQWEAGMTLPSVSNLIKLCEFYEITLDEMVCDELTFMRVGNLLNHFQIVGWISLRENTLLLPDHIMQSITLKSDKFYILYDSNKTLMLINDHM